MKEHYKEMKKRLYAKDTALSKGLSHISRWNQLTISDKDSEFQENFNRVISDESIPDGPGDRIIVNEGNDNYLNIDITLPCCIDNALMRIVAKQSRTDDDKDNFISIENSNPLLDTQDWLCQWDDWNHDSKYHRKKLLAQIDIGGHKQMLLDKIIDHSTNLSVGITKENRFTTSSSGIKILKKTTARWEISIQWKDGSSDWV